MTSHDHAPPAARAVHTEHRVLPFFVYGTLRPGGRYHATHLGDAVAAGGTVEPARLPGAVLYDGPGYPYAVPAPAPAEVLGELVTARPDGYRALLGSLDGLEEYRGAGDPRNLYDRVVREVLRADGTAVPAWVYLAAAPVAERLRRGGTRIARGDWLGRARAAR
ncbi:gamma-glutamylcyclotransferase family protein [Streptomyces sp. NPDC127068]|uniref:gamma-glutamylcyclotransferase family protein n=1 Tax=Streptomyces sp. NPDC127068 TaxID=3347127 RepID=UPI003655C5FE